MSLKGLEVIVQVLKSRLSVDWEVVLLDGSGEKSIFPASNSWSGSGRASFFTKLACKSVFICRNDVLKSVENVISLRKICHQSEKVATHEKGVVRRGLCGVVVGCVKSR